MVAGENTTQARDALDDNGQVHQEPSPELVEVSEECEADPGGLHVTHLLAGERELLVECHRHGVYLTLCGEVVPVSQLESSECEPGCGRMVTYCEDCLHVAVGCNSDAGLVWSPPGSCLLTEDGDGAAR